MTDRKPRLGLLPLYLALYDKVAPQHRPQVEAFAKRVCDRLAAAGLAVDLAPICCLKPEVEAAVAELASRKVDLLATLHLAYSPSLEAADPLVSTDLPLVLLDTTPAPRFAEKATMDDMFRNHGIHGVQDLASVLRRRGRGYSVVAGHVEEAGFLREITALARAARAARHFRSLRVLVFGDEFVGMGDFAVAPELMAATLGPTARRVPASELRARVQRVTERELADEATADAKAFDSSGITRSVLRTSNQIGLAIRAMLEESASEAFSFNFESFRRENGLPTVPFLEASKAMARGIGYAGEGDALTAALVGALLAGFGEVTFTEMFCPDWEGNSVFMSHMGECNPRLAASTPTLVEKQYILGNAENPVIVTFPLRPGPATLVNLAPGPDNTFGLIATRVRILDRWSRTGFPDVPHFWVQPVDLELRDFLRRYSEVGGTHHLALMLGDHIPAVRHLAHMLGLALVEIRPGASARRRGSRGAQREC